MTRVGSEADEAKPWVELVALAEAGDGAGLEALLEELGEHGRIHALGHVDGEARAAVLAACSAERAAELLEEIPLAHATEAVHELNARSAAEILEELPSDEQADLIAELTDADADAILAASAADMAQSVRTLLRFPSDSAGGRMMTEFVAVPASLTVHQVVEHLRDNVERYADYVVQYVYAVGSNGELQGVVPLRDLLLSRPERPLASLMIREPVSVRAEAPLEQLFELFDAHAYVGVPVLDQTDELVGVLLREDVDEARIERAEAGERKSRGIVGGEELRSMPLLLRSRRRLAWLSLNIVLNILAASIIAMYQDTLTAVIALAVFLPIISDMSGCSGNQAVAVSLRELSLGVTRPTEYLRVWWQEASVGLLNGVVLGALIGAVAWAWQGKLALGIVVGVALAANTLVAVSIGGVVPLALRRLGYDPALASGPILTTITDMCGFALVLSLATLGLAHLTP